MPPASIKYLNIEVDSIKRDTYKFDESFSQKQIPLKLIFEVNFSTKEEEKQNESFQCKGIT